MTHVPRIGFGLALVALLIGCVGYVDGGPGGYYGGGPDTDVYLFGGDYGHERGRDVHAYSHRGAQSRGAVHSGGFAHASAGGASHGAGGHGGGR